MPRLITGLGYNTVAKPAEPVIISLWITSIRANLIVDMYNEGFLMTGTVSQNRLLPLLNNFKRWAKFSRRGQSSYTRDEHHIIQYTQCTVTKKL